MKTLKITLRAWPVIFLAAATLCVLTKWGAALLGVELHEQKSLEIVLSARGWKLAKLLGFVLVAAPLLEELVFRFLLFKGPCWIWSKIKPAARCGHRALPAAVAVVSSIAFVALHYGKPNPFPDNAFIALFFFGLAQCWLYRKTSWLWAAILNHMLFNLTNLAFLFALPG